MAKREPVTDSRLSREEYANTGYDLAAGCPEPGDGGFGGPGALSALGGGGGLAMRKPFGLE